MRKKTPNTGPAYAMLQNNLTGRECASSWSLSRSYGLPIERVREKMALMGVRDEDKE